MSNPADRTLCYIRTYLYSIYSVILDRPWNKAYKNSSNTNNNDKDDDDDDDNDGTAAAAIMHKKLNLVNMYFK